MLNSATYGWSLFLLQIALTSLLVLGEGWFGPTSPELASQRMWLAGGGFVIGMIMSAGYQKLFAMQAAEEAERTKDL
jgi:hypothetical protein